MNWSQYQQSIFEAVSGSRESLIIEAVAGSGKTTTIVEAINHVGPGQKVCFLAFNKAIADTLKGRIGARAKCLTLHAAGWAAWRGWLAWDAGECKVDQYKVAGIVRDMMSWEDRKQYPAVGRLVGLAKQVGIVPNLDAVPRIDCAGLVPDTDDAWEGLIDHYGLDPEECSIELARKVLAKSIEESRERVDYDDMLYMPVVAGAAFEQFDVVFVDEAQDVSGIQMEMLRRMVRLDPGDGPCEGRLIAVGDPNQAIYGFRGAHASSMALIQERFRCVRLPLSVSYRCPVTVVMHARQWQPQMEWAEGSMEGYVGLEGTDWAAQAEIALGEPCKCPEHAGACECLKEDWTPREGVSKWRGIEDFARGDAILCRINRPLVALAFRLIRMKVPARVLGRDIGQGIVKLARKLGKNLSQEGFSTAFEAAMEGYHAREGARLLKRKEAAALASLEDRLDTLQVFVDDLGPEDGLEELARNIESLFADAQGGGMEGWVNLATVHKAKGLEWERVFVLDAGKWMPGPWARDGWEMEAERNIQYVAATRTRRELRYIRSEEL